MSLSFSFVHLQDGGMGIYNAWNASLNEKMAQTLEEEDQIWSTKI